MPKKKTKRITPENKNEETLKPDLEQEPQGKTKYLDPEKVGVIEALSRLEEVDPRIFYDLIHKKLKD